MAKNEKKDIAQEVEGEFREVEQASPVKAGNTAPMPFDAAQDMIPMPPVVSKPKKKHGKKIILGVIAVAVVGFIGYSMISSALRGPAPLYAETQAAETGTIYQTINTTGTIQSGEKITVFSPVTAPVVAVDGELGRYIEAGTPMVTFGTTELERSYRQAAAARGLSSLQAQASLENSKESQTTVNDSQASINNLRDQRDRAKNLIAQFQGDKANVMAEFPNYAAEKAELITLQGIAAPSAEEQARIQELILSTGVVDARLAEIDGKIAVQQADLSSNQALLSQMETINSTADKTVLDQNGQQQLKAQGVASQVAFETAQANLNAAQQGLQAPISGIITSLAVEEGSAATQYTPLFVIESLDKVEVVVSLSRFDVERVKEGQKAVVSTLGKDYNAVVSKVNSMATQVAGGSGTSAFVMATITLDNPDRDIRLGLEASVEISTGKADNVVKVPVSAVNTDIDGTHCFIVVDGIAYRRDVTIGISSDTEVEILSGVEVGDNVVLNSQNIFDGAKVSDDPIYKPAAGGGMFG